MEPGLLLAQAKKYSNPKGTKKKPPIRMMLAPGITGITLVTLLI